ncbi:metal-dependent hydrolase [Halobium salinum]|uniref:Metal-dependent hydrolase n=1 Tax=Halobium salinum TaxID=1364940 RepID=A0ABD5PJQ8_9EURY|nr:metal-dependent hydrolase [Halobium salinum]
MWPFGHWGVGYLLYAAFSRSAYRRSSTGPEALLLTIGTQFPDLVDKPLAWSFGVIPSGRSLTHSLFAAALLVALAILVTDRYGRREYGVAFGVGTVVHSLTDGVAAVVAREFADLSYLLWPVLATPEYETEKSFMAHFAQFSLDGAVAVQLGLFFAGLVVWYADGKPGLETVRLSARRAVDRTR